MKKYGEIALVVLAVMWLAPRTPFVKDIVKAPSA